MPEGSGAPDIAGEQDIRGIDVQKAVVGFSDNANIFKNFVRNSKTKAREVRWFQKTAGFLDTTDTTDITASQIPKGAERALPWVTGPQHTRNTSYVLKFFIGSQTISIEDIKDTDVDILGTTIRDLVLGVQRQVDIHIYNILTESQSPSDILTTAATGAGWDDEVAGDPILDLLIARQKIMVQGYPLDDAVVAMNPIEHRHLMQFLISVKGSSIPNFSSEKVRTGVTMELLGLRVIVSEHAITNSVPVWLPRFSANYKQFMPMKSATVDDPGIGKKIRVWEEGICLLTDPKSVHLTSATIS